MKGNYTNSQIGAGSQNPVLSDMSQHSHPATSTDQKHEESKSSLEMSNIISSLFNISKDIKELSEK